MEMAAFLHVWQKQLAIWAQHLWADGSKRCTQWSSHSHGMLQLQCTVALRPPAASGASHGVRLVLTLTSHQQSQQRTNVR
jgi:hypothetical protein